MDRSRTNKQLQTIHQKLNQIREAGTKNSYELSVSYLLSIIQGLLGQQINQYQHSSRVSQSIFSRRSSSQSKNSGFVSVHTPIHASFQGSQVSVVERVISDINRDRKDKKKLEKLDLRGLQKSIQIYHQCLGKCIQTIIMQAQQLQAKGFNRKRERQRLEQYWKDYEQIKKKCRKFNDLVNLSENNLSKQFVSFIKPFQKCMEPSKKVQPTQYVLVND